MEAGPLEEAGTESVVVDGDRLKEDEAGRAETGTAGLLGELVASDAEPTRDGDECGWTTGEDESAGGVALSEAVGGEAGTGLLVLLVAGEEEADVGSFSSSPSGSCCCRCCCCCLSPPFPFPPVAAAKAMLDVFCSSSADGRLLNEADRMPFGVVLPFFFQKASLANASLEAAEADVEEVGEEEEGGVEEGGDIGLPLTGCGDVTSSLSLSFFAFSRANSLLDEVEAVIPPPLLLLVPLPALLSADEAAPFASTALADCLDDIHST